MTIFTNNNIQDIGYVLSYISIIDVKHQESSCYKSKIFLENNLEDKD